MIESRLVEIMRESASESRSVLVSGMIELLREQFPSMSYGEAMTLSLRLYERLTSTDK